MSPKSKRRIRPRRGVSFVLRAEFPVLEPRLLLSAVDVLTYHNDNQRTGQDLDETTLTPANVNTRQFGKIGSYAVDGAVYAQPLVMSAVPIPGHGTRDVVFVATEHDSVYAFDADPAGNPAILWRTSFLRRGVTPVHSGDVGSDDIRPEIGITGTPVIDPSTGTLYVVAKTKEGGHVVQRLHALDIATGKEKGGGPVVIQATVSGSGDGHTRGDRVSFNALTENQRSALALSNGVVYIAWASHGDNTPFHGWILGYDARTLRQVAVYNDTPNGADGGIWESGGGPAFDAQGNLFVSIGNGSFDGDKKGVDLGSSVVKFSTRGGLTPVNAFTPFNVSLLNKLDADLGSGGAVVLPDQPGAHPHLLVAGGKDGTIRLLDRDNLGGFQPNDAGEVQVVAGAIPALFSTPAYYDGALYVIGGRYTTGDAPMAFALSGGRLSAAPVSEAPNAFGAKGSTPSISANGDQDGILWALDNGGAEAGRPSVLDAYDASDLSHVLYASNRAGGRDQAGPAVKFTVPTVANGKVYVGGNGVLTIYGLL